MSQKHPNENNQGNVRLRDISQCSKSLDFAPLVSWPQGLPAVSVNGFVLAGFQQSVVFDHQLENSRSAEIAALFRSLYFDLSAVELSRLAEVGHKQAWFPVSEIFERYNIRWSDQIQNLARKISELPPGFQKFCAEKKWNFADFSSLLSAKDLSLNDLYLQLVTRNLSHSLSVQIFEIFIELRLLDIPPEDLMPTENENSELWYKRLRIQRYPQASRMDEEASEKIKGLPWPGSSSARWTRQGDRAGIELKLFVSNPTDLKKYVESLSLIQNVLEKDGPWKKH